MKILYYKCFKCPSEETAQTTKIPVGWKFTKYQGFDVLTCTKCLKEINSS